MITITDKRKCCGCEGCRQVCPKQCIAMHRDEEGFLYPAVDEPACIHCNLCDKVCPVLNQSEPQAAVESFVAKSSDEATKLKSSSGGVFTELAKAVLRAGGVVFGARFDTDWQVVHDYTTTEEDLTAFQGSKYAQSRIGNAYREAEKFLRAGHNVLFSGVPCQIAGLKKYLRKDYPNLLAVDVVCHAVPSPMVWADYIKRFGTKKNKIRRINFRDKRQGWSNYGLSVVRADDSEDYILMPENPYMGCFLKDYSVRPSCYECPAKIGKSGSDITLGDFWGIENTYPQYRDAMGSSCVIVRSGKGSEAMRNINAEIHPVEYAAILSGNRSLEISASEPHDRELFWKKYRSKRNKYKVLRIFGVLEYIPLWVRIKRALLPLVKTLRLR